LSEKNRRGAFGSQAIALVRICTKGASVSRQTSSDEEPEKKRNRLLRSFKHGVRAVPAEVGVEPQLADILDSDRRGRAAADVDDNLRAVCDAAVLV
jgi:hypothetical protein